MHIFRSFSPPRALTFILSMPQITNISPEITMLRAGTLVYRKRERQRRAVVITANCVPPEISTAKNALPSTSLHHKRDQRGSNKGGRGGSSNITLMGFLWRDFLKGATFCDCKTWHLTVSNLLALGVKIYLKIVFFYDSPFSNVIREISPTSCVAFTARIAGHLGRRQSTWRSSGEPTWMGWLVGAMI